MTNLLEGNMSRKLKNWLDGYVEYTENTESAKIFHPWIGRSMIAAALRKKVWLHLGRIKVFPNLYIVLVAEPGIVRKSQSISYGVDILNEITNVELSADAITKEALLQDLEACANDEQMPNGDMFRHSSLSVISREFESFLGQKQENTKMLVLLTDLFDCQELPWKYRTKNSGTNTIPSVYLNILGATTPESLASTLPITAIGGGLTSRIIFIWGSKKNKKIPIPFLSPKLYERREALINDLTVISRIAGGYNFSSKCQTEWEHWYMRFDERSPSRLCKDPAFNGWYSRKPMFILKLAIINAAIRHSNLIIEWEDISQAILDIEEAEGAMSQTFIAVGRSDVSPEVNMVANIIEAEGSISEPSLLQRVWRDVDAKKFYNVIDTVIKRGVARRAYTGPSGEKEIWYHACNRKGY
jgi:hypothetical protein